MSDHLYHYTEGGLYLDGHLATEVCEHCDTADTVRSGPNPYTLTTADIIAATERRWDLRGPVPVPRIGWWRCGSCATPRRPHPRRWRYHHYKGYEEEHRVPWRCDISLKCVECGQATVHGIALPRDYYHANAANSGRWSDHQDALLAIEADHGPLRFGVLSQESPPHGYPAP